MICPRFKRIGANVVHFNGVYVISNEYQLLPLARLCTAFVESSAVPSTQRARRNDIQQLLAFMSADPQTLQLGDYNKASIDKFIAHQLEKEAPTNVVRRYWTFRAFDKWLAKAVPNFQKPTHEITPPTIEQKAPVGISEEDAAQLIEAAYRCGSTDAIRLRNGVAVELLYNTGLRASEARHLREEQLSADKRWFIEVKCKGQHYRDVYIPKSFDEKLNEWLKVRRFMLRGFGARQLPACPILIPMLQPAEPRKPESYILNGKAIWIIVDAAAKEAGLEGVHPHMLRHGYAHELLENTKDIRLVAQALGHRSIETTMRYTKRSHDRLGAIIEEAMNGKARPGLSGETVRGGAGEDLSSPSSKAKPTSNH